MKKIIIVFLSIVYSQIAFADMCTLTVVAESGLSLRKEANLKSERLKVVKFGETVLADGICNFNYPRFTDSIIEIDGLKGFWMKVRFEKTWGYMFSGYLVIGDVFPYSRNDTISNVILDEIFSYEDEGIYKIDSFNYQFYSPKLNWYGVKVNETSTSISKTVVTPIYNNDRWDKDNESLFHVYLQVANDEQYDFLFGTKKELQPGIIESNYHQNCEDKVGVFLFPEQEFSVDFNKRRYNFKAHEDITKDKKQQIRREYTINLFIWRDEIEIVNKKNILNLYGDAKTNVVYKNPRLYWSGDLNKDGNLDFVFEVSPMADKCGAYQYLKFLYSDKDNNGKVVYKANNDILEFDNFKKK